MTQKSESVRKFKRLEAVSDLPKIRNKPIEHDPNGASSYGKTSISRQVLNQLKVQDKIDSVMNKKVSKLSLEKARLLNKQFKPGPKFRMASYVDHTSVGKFSGTRAASVGTVPSLDSEAPLYQTKKENILTDEQRTKA